MNSAPNDPVPPVESDGRQNSAAQPGQEFDEARAAVLPAFLETVRKNAPNLDAGLANSLASLGATMLARQALGQQAKPPASSPSQQEPKTADVIQLAFWGEDYRAAPNAIFRSSLFPALHPTQKENRRFLDEEEIFCVAGLKIFFTGKQFDQSDLDVYLEILNMAKHFPLGTPVKFSAHALLKALGLTTGGENHARLHRVLIRLCGGVVDATDHGKRYFGQLLHGGLRDEITQNYEIRINPDFAVLFGFGMFAKIDLEKRRALGRNNTAKALYGYYASHINPTAHNIETLANLAGLTNSNKRQTKAAIIKAHEIMKAVGCIEGYIVTGDSIKAEVNPNPSQARAIIKQATQPKERKPRRRNAMTPAGDLLPGLLPPKK